MNEDFDEPEPDDCLTTKASAVRYWERHRWIFLALLVPSAAAGYHLTEEVPSALGDKEFISPFRILIMFAVGFINANIAYSFAYVVEFGFLGTSKYDDYAKKWRPLLLAAGCILGIALAFGAARSIAFEKFTPI